MKKFLSTLVAAVMTAGCFTACSGKAPAVSDDKLKIVTTIFPAYDWVMNVLGDNPAGADVTMLLDNGADLHSFQPTAEDIVEITTSDMFVYVGGESDEWVDDILKEAVNKEMIVINLMDVLGDSVKEEEMVEGMQADEHEHHHDHDDEDEHDHDDEHEHGKEVSVFEESEVQDRNLTDWEGEWQSPYPFVLDGSLDPAFEAMEETKGEMTAEEYKEYYKTGYETDIVSVNIKGNNIEYTYEDGRKVNSDYKYTGYYIQVWSGGTMAALYRFEAENKDSGAPVYIEINDHMIESAKAEHFHLRMSNESFDAIKDPEKYWPTFFPADMSAEELCDHFSGGHKQDEDNHEEYHDHEHHHDHEEGEVEYDEHVWLSLKNAAVLTAKLSESIQTLDPANKDVYKKNADAYIEKLNSLDKEYQAAVDAGSVKTLLFGDRFPFRYLVDDYGLKYYAAFIGCSSESEASFETITFLSKKVDELSLKAVLTIEGPDHKIAETIIENTSTKDQKILTMDSMQSTTAKDVEGGATYFSIMENNLTVLKEAVK